MIYNLFLEPNEYKLLAAERRHLGVNLKQKRTYVRGIVLKSTPEIHYFCIDNELVYENYYSDFGPLNLGCVYKYCKILNEKLKQYLNKQKIVHYTSAEARKKANAAFLIGCYGILYLSLTPKDSLKPLLLHRQTYRPFQDATQGDSCNTISLMDCLCALRKARELGFFSFQDFNYEEYERLDKIQGGDLNWIVPGKFLAFIGPVDYSVSLFHPPEMYIDYFKDNNVKIVIRLNKRMYDGDVFNNAGIMHYDLFFPDGSYPPRHILLKFLQIAEESDAAIAVHCKAGLGRTGSLIGAYLIKHYRMTAHEAIGWMRICRPGSVIGHQQDWMERMEPWLIKQGNIYRKRTFQDTEKFPIHEFGVYSISERVLRQRPVVFSKPLSPPPPMQRQTRSDTTPPVRPQASKVREAPNKASEKDQYEWRMRSSKTNTNAKTSNRGRDSVDTGKAVSRRGSGAGEPRPPAHAGARSTNARVPRPRNNNELNLTPVPTFRTTQGPVLKTINDAKSFLMRSSFYGQQRESKLHQAITVTPHYTVRPPAYPVEHVSNLPTLAAYGTKNFSVSRVPPPQPRRRCLGRSPSPSPSTSPTRIVEHTRATNTNPSNVDRFFVRDSKVALREALSRLKLQAPRDGSIGAASVGAASLGARRDAPAAKRAPSVRSDERPLATQGDMLNSIKFQRRFRDTLNADKISAIFNEKVSTAAKDKPSSKVENSRISLAPKVFHQEFSPPRDKNNTSTSKFFSSPRPTSPKGRTRTSFY
ncbi:uncharacterized protein LOC126376860 [Pectinophora gossypiella]|uniref:uncharacterized protein LOC126376860 n=1 Tax=Pectinophora gossypiella TaxID=13191 RepID=UPI00214E1263|nr:uncharacterized protein LOC126376860 [Pectinophora gossypiella]